MYGLILSQSSKFPVAEEDSFYTTQVACRHFWDDIIALH